MLLIYYEGAAHPLAQLPNVDWYIGMMLAYSSRCFYGFDPSYAQVQQKHVVVVKVALLLIVFYWIIPTTERASEKKNGRKATDLTGAKTQKNSRQKLQSLSLFLSE